MGEMVRKQITIQERQERMPKRISKVRGVSEAELIRQVIDRETIGRKSYLLAPHQASWKKILSFVENRKSPRPSGRAYKWNRLDAYEEREISFAKRGNG